MWLSYALFFLRDKQNIELPKADEEVSKSPLNIPHIQAHERMENASTMIMMIYFCQEITYYYYYI